MSVTRHAQVVAAARLEAAQVAQRAEYRSKLERLRGAFDPPLSNAELSLALGLRAPREGTTGIAEAARFLSDSARWRKARPDGATRALIDALLAGEVLLAARRPVPGARREMLACVARDVLLLGPGWQLRNLAGLPLPERAAADWEDGSLWNLFDAPTATPPVAPARPVARVGEGGGGVLRLAGRPTWRLAFGAMRLSTGVDAAGNDVRPERSQALLILARALDAGIDWIDTADAYALPGDEPGHNELLIAEVLRGGRWPEVRVATKAGLVRIGKGYAPNGRPEHLRAACEGSLRRLGVDALDLLQLHAPDRQVPYGESVGELARLRAEGKVRAVGVCNVSLEQLEIARGLVEVASVQNAFSFVDPAPLAQGLWQRCRALGIPLLAHSPLGGWRGVGKAAGSPPLVEVARRLGKTPQQAALAWLLSVPGVLPLVGATREASLDASLDAATLTLDAAAVDTLDAAVESRPRFRGRRSDWRAAPPAAGAWPAPTYPTTPAAATEGEVVLFVGPPAAGKTSLVTPFVDGGYHRLNRDQVGGRLEDLLPLMRQELRAGRRHFVLDNTYATRAARRGVLDIARTAGLPVRALWLDTPVEEALYNACLRMLERCGRILDPEEVKTLSRKNPNLLPPAAIYRFFETFEEPTAAEGFAAIERVPFVRRQDPERHREKALVLDVDGTLRTTTTGAPFPRHPNEVLLLPGRREALLRWQGAGYRLLAVSNQAHVGLGQVSDEVARACFARTLELLGLEIDIRYSPQPPIGAGAWTRKPMPGLGVTLIEEYGLARDACVYVGDLDADRDFARNCGFRFHLADAFFAEPGIAPG